MKTKPKFKFQGFKDPYIGFESTWRYKDPGTCLKLDKYDDISSDVLTSDIEYIRKFSALSLWKRTSSDPHNIEIQTVPFSIHEERELGTQFSKLENLLSEYGLTMSSVSPYSSYEGGGHIHMDLSLNFGSLESLTDYASKEEYSKCLKLASRFIRNMIVWTVNHPWVPWAFNNPNDDHNAKNPCFNPWLRSNLQEFVNSNNSRYTEKNGRLLTITQKNWATIFRSAYKTIEFRFFSMPKNAKQLQFNIDFSRAVFKEVYNITLAGIDMPIKYDCASVVKIKEIFAKKSLSQTLERLGLSVKKARSFGLYDNISTRYIFEKALRIKNRKSFNKPYFKIESHSKSRLRLLLSKKENSKIPIIEVLCNNLKYDDSFMWDVLTSREVETVLN